MSDERRNRRFSKKTRENTEKSGKNASQSRRSSGMRNHGRVSAPRKAGESQKKRSGSGREGGAGWIWGFHAANAALGNSRRTIHDIFVTDKVRDKLSLGSGHPAPRLALPSEIDRLLPGGASHQGIALKAAPLEWPDISDIAHDAPDDGVILVLDQITDPHNVGAMLRLCSAFGVSALVLQSRHAPPLSGALAKVAVGCLETVPVCQVTNIGNSLQDLAKTGWFITGLAGETDLDISAAVGAGGRRVIVMGAEGPGLRARVRTCCDQLARIPMQSAPLPGQAESLNVATAAAIALYESRRQK
ncbi:MAG: RNA methyltransferase [Hellea sp.]|nr:RNA methyltransferase [Hellea sp.]